MAETVMGNVVAFLDKVGVYDVILPFLLVFTIVYAILDKTRVLGFEKVGGETYPRRNLNSMVAFVMGFLVVASSQLVALINEAMANVVVLMLLSVSYLMLVGVLYKQADLELKQGSTELYVFLFINFIGVVLIFLHAVPTENGSNWLTEILDFLALNWQRDYVGAVILIAAVVLFMRWIVGPGPQPAREGGK
ncbi:hypothetical protein HY639_01000 [Candidatus Woesearchaeota archaeon]|nr:hypothetical protein [Candidatus Woesearchaeota archaeon]